MAAGGAPGSAAAGGASAPVSGAGPLLGRRLEELQALFLRGFRQAGAILRFETYCQSTPPLGTRGAREGRVWRQGGGHGPMATPEYATALDKILVT